MKQQELLGELILYASARFKDLHQAAKERLTQEEWLERATKTTYGQGPGVERLTSKQKEELVSLRKLLKFTDPEEIAQLWAAEMLPFVEAARSALKSRGRMTAKQIDRAMQMRYAQLITVQEEYPGLEMPVSKEMARETIQEGLEALEELLESISLAEE